VVAVNEEGSVVSVASGILWMRTTLLGEHFGFATLSLTRLERPLKEEASIASE